MTNPDGTQQTRVLVVDDEPNIAQLVAMALRYEGFVAETASDGRGALATVRTFGPYLVILDAMLADLDGFEVGRRLRAAAEPADHRRRIRTVAVTLAPAAATEMEPLRLALHGLTPREREVAQLLTRGATNDHVAPQLDGKRIREFVPADPPRQCRGP